MWIVRLALRRPYTFTVMALLIVELWLAVNVGAAAALFAELFWPQRQSHE